MDQVRTRNTISQLLFVVLWPEPCVTGRFAAALIMFVASMFWVAADTAFAQQRATTVDVGKTKSFGLLREVNPPSINISTDPPGIAEVRLDTDKSKLRIRGVSPGSTLVTVSGTYRRIEFPPIPRPPTPGGPPRPGENRPPREVADPFRHTIRVTVLPRILEPDRRAIDITVSRGFTRTYQLHIFMGPAFRNENEEGIRWRDFRVTPGDNNIAKADVNRMRIGITGVNGGQTTITLTGERLFQGTWQRVVRDLRVRVGGATRASSNTNQGSRDDNRRLGSSMDGLIDTNPNREEKRPAANPNREEKRPAANPIRSADAWLDALGRRYKEIIHTPIGRKSEFTAGQKASVLRQLEDLRTVLENGTRTLESDPNGREERLRRRRILLAEIERDIRRLRGN